MSKSIEKYLGPEDNLQIQVCQYIRLQYPGARVHHSPNEGKRGWVLQYKVKHMGVSSGFLDLFIVYRGFAMAMELKAGKNRATDAQNEWIKILTGAGIPAKVCTGFDEARVWIDNNLGPLKRGPIPIISKPTT